MSVLVADIGGTNARLAIVDALGTVQQLRKFKVKNHAGPEDVLSIYLDEFTGPSPEVFCAGVAGPVSHNKVRLTNHNWQIDGRELAQRFGFKSANLINDFVAQAWALPHLSSDDLLPIGSFVDDIKPLSTKLVLGPGTGMGVAAMAFAGHQPVVINGEGGHIGLAPECEEDIELLRLLHRRYQRVSVEHVLCGSGLVVLYNTLAEIRGEQAKVLEPRDIVALADDEAEQIDGICRQAVAIFCRLLGGFAGDMALSFGAFGGTYLTGGVSKALKHYLPTSSFRKHFEAKGPMAGFVADIPTFLVVSDTSALAGAAAYVKHSLES